MTHNQNQNQNFYKFGTKSHMIVMYIVTVNITIKNNSIDFRFNVM